MSLCNNLRNIDVWQIKVDENEDKYGNFIGTSGDLIFKEPVEISSSVIFKCVSNGHLLLIRVEIN